MSSLNQQLEHRLRELKEQNLLRELRPVASPQAVHLRIHGESLVNFSSNDYLGLANHPVLKRAAAEAAEAWGAGSGASRLICGSLQLHHALEESLAQFKGTAAALVFSSGYATALGTIGALVSKADFIVLDKRVHASIVDAARLSGARMRVFRHNDPDDLERILQWCAKERGTSPERQILIATESVFSMDGDQAPLKEIVQLKERYDAWLMVDEAHATGLYGTIGSGLIEQLGLAGQVEIQMGTLGKALGSSGGYIAGTRPLVDYLVNRSRSFLFSTAPNPASAGAAIAAIELVRSPEGRQRVQALWRRVAELRTALSPTWRLPATESAILPLILGNESRALSAAARMRNRGYFIPAIRYPTVARGQARLRVTVTSEHSMEEIAGLAGVLLQEGVTPPTALLDDPVPEP